LGIGDWGLGPIPNPQSPIPNIYYKLILNNKKIYLLNLINLKYLKYNNNYLAYIFYLKKWK